jgi:hypothetical protein
MALYKATLKRTSTVNGVRMEKGMSVNVVTKYTSNPLTINGGEDVREAFLRIYGIDLRKAWALSSSYIEMQKIS